MTVRANILAYRVPRAVSGTLTLSAPSQTFTVNSAYSVDLNAYTTGGTGGPYWHTLIAGTLPKDLTLTGSGRLATTAREITSGTITVRASDTNASALAADWHARTHAPGVQWYHDFSADAEVTRWTIPDADSGYMVDELGVRRVRRITTDGWTGGALEIRCPGSSHNRMSWSRPLMCVSGDPGYVNDGTWRTADVTSSAYIYYWSKFRRGIHGHPDYWLDNTPGQGSDGFNYAGWDFWLQIVYKNVNAYDAEHEFNGSNGGGKVFYIDLAGGGSGEVIVHQFYGQNKHFRMYTNFGHSNNSDMGATQGINPVLFGTSGSLINTMQPESQWASGGAYPWNQNSMWCYPDDTSSGGMDRTKFCAFLFHVVPGHQCEYAGTLGNRSPTDINSPNHARDTAVEVWKQDYGETDYTLVYRKHDLVFLWDPTNPNDGDPMGMNVFTLSTYMNGAVAGAKGFARRIPQIIKSSQWIPPVRVWPT